MTEAATRLAGLLSLVPEVALLCLGLVAGLGFVVAFALPRRVRLPVRVAALVVALGALSTFVGLRIYERVHPPLVRTCYVPVPMEPPPSGTRPGPGMRLGRLGKLLAEGVVTAEAARRAAVLLREGLDR